MKVYAGVPAAARSYLEADRSRADDYYLTEGPGLARRYTASGGRVQELTPLAGDTYEAWVAGRDPDSGEPRGRLRNDDQAVRFVEVVVNGPKSGSRAGSPAPRAATRTSVPAQSPGSLARRRRSAAARRGAACTHRRTALP